MGDPDRLIRLAELTGGALVGIWLVYRLFRWFGGAEERKQHRMLRQALDSGDLRRAGDLQLGRGLYREAARIYERGNEWARAGRALVKAGDDKLAAQAYEKAKDFSAAAPLFKKAHEYLRAAECYEKSENEARAAADCYALAKRPLQAARLFEKLGHIDRAAEEYGKLDKLDPPDHLVVLLENAAMMETDPARQKSLWQRAGDQALKLGAHLRAAQDLDRAGDKERAALLFQEAKARGNTVAAEVANVPSNDTVSYGKGRAGPRPNASPPSEGRFELLGELGRGGMGVVYKARDKLLDRPVALKFLPPDMETDPSLVRVFRREARAAAVLTHPGIVTVYDVGTLDGREFIAMELVEGVTLDRVLEEHGPMPLRQALDLFEKVLDAVAEAHERGVVHRDLKPGNLMRTKSGVKVMDFGLAKLSSSSSQRTSNQTVLGGTPAYMPPEQMTGGADHRADVFALGATFYELLTGKIPGKNGAPASVARDYPSPRELVSTVPERLSQTIMRCLTHDVNDRLQDVATLKREVQEARSALAAIESDLKAFLRS